MPISNALAPIIPVIMAQGLGALRSRCVMPRLVNNSYSSQATEKGQVITIPVPSDIQTTEIVPGPYAPDTGNLTPSVAQITLDNWREAAFTLTENELAQVGGGYVPRQVTSAIEALSNDVNASIFNCHKKIGNSVGTAGQNPFATTVDTAVDAKEALTLMKTPPGDRRLVLDVTAMGAALKLSAFHNVSSSGDPNVMTEGEIGRKYGFPWYEDQSVPRHVAGTQTGTVSAKSATAVPAGATQFIIATAASSSVNYKVGDIIKIAGHARSYSVKQVLTLGASTEGIVVLNGRLFQPLVGGENITLVSSHTANLAFHADCFGFASRALSPTAGAEPSPFSMDVADPVSGLTLRLQVREEYHRIRWAFDILWGVDVVREQLGLRVLGQ